MNETSTGFRASLFHPNFGNEVVEGRIFIDRSKLRFTSENVVLDIPIERLEADWEESNGRISFKDSEDSQLSVFTLDQAVLKIAFVPQLDGLHQRADAIQSRREFSHRLRITLYFLVGCAVFAWGFSWLTGVMVRSIATRVPPEWERKFGEEAIKRIKVEDSLTLYSNQVKQLAELAAPLLQVLPKGGAEVKFYIVDNPMPNAFALPGGSVVVNSGLLELADRPEEIQGVLAHELAHVTQKHLIRKLVAASGPILIFGVFLHSNSGLMNVLAGGSALMVFQGFSKEFETEADEVGWKYLVSANIDPRGMISMFHKFETVDKLKSINIELPQAFSSHPLLQKRIARLESKWKKLQPKDGFLVQTNQVPKPPSN